MAICGGWWGVVGVFRDIFVFIDVGTGGVGGHAMRGLLLHYFGESRSTTRYSID